MLQKIIEITAETLGAEAESITENTSFTEDLHADSLDLFELAMALEEEFGVEIPSEDLEKITTVGAAAATWKRISNLRADILPNKEIIRVYKNA